MNAPNWFRWNSTKGNSADILSSTAPFFSDASSITPVKPQGLLQLFENWSLRTRLFSIVLALALPLNFAIVAVVWSLAGAAQEAQRASLLYSARSVTTGLDAELGKYLALAMALSRSPTLFSDDLTAFRAEARRAFESVPDAWVLVADLEGQQLVNTAVPDSQKLPKRLPIAIERQRKAVESARPLISGIRLGPVTQRWAAVIDVPIFKDGRPYRILVVTMTADAFVSLFNGRNLPNNWIAGIIDEDGKYVARVPEHDRVVGQLASEGWRQTAGREGIFEFASRDGDSVVNANDISKLANWTVGIAIKKSALNAVAWSTTQWAVIFGAVLSALSLMLATQLARRISAHLRNLQTDAREIVAGRLRPSSVPKIPEMADVWKSLETAANERNASEDRLRRSHDTYFRLIKNAVFGVYLVDAEFKLAEVSAGAQKVFQNVMPLIGRDFSDVLNILWPPKFAHEVVDRFRHTLDTGEPYQSENTSEIRGDTALREAYDWRIERVTLPDGRFGVVCYFYDLSERLKQEDHIRLLMNEINHRSKNLIGLSQAIARRTQACSTEQFVERFCQRLDALAANQDILVKTEFRGADLAELARAQLAAFSEQIGGRIKICGPSLLLNSQAAQAIGMAFHELATNAAKYGALSNDRGSIRLTWTVADGILNCEWREYDGPLVVAPTRKGFGTTVTCQMVQMSISGAVTLRYEPSGLRWTMECPVENVDMSASPRNE